LRKQRGGEVVLIMDGVSGCEVSLAHLTYPTLRAGPLPLPPLRGHRIHTS